MQSECQLATCGWTHRWLRWICDRVVDLVATVTHVAQDCVGLFDQIDLETDVVYDIRPLPGDGHDGDEIDERYTTSSIIDEGCLTLLARVEHSLQMSDSDIVGILSLGPFDDFAIRR